MTGILVTQGQALANSLNEGEGRVRNDMRLVMRAIREGWTIDPAIKAAVVNRAGAIVNDPDAKGRDVARASSTLLAVERLSLDAAKEEDRIARLDNGGATEAMTIQVITGVPPRNAG